MKIKAKPDPMTDPRHKEAAAVEEKWNILTTKSEKTLSECVFGPIWTFETILIKYAGAA